MLTSFAVSDEFFDRNFRYVVGIQLVKLIEVFLGFVDVDLWISLCFGCV